MAKPTKKSTSRTNKSNENFTGREELSHGVLSIVEGTTNSLLYILATIYELTMTGSSFLSQKFGSNEAKIRNIKEAIINHHRKQAETAATNAGHEILKIFNGGYHTAKGLARDALLSGNETIESLKNNNPGNKTKKTTPNNSAKNRKQRNRSTLKEAA